MSRVERFHPPAFLEDFKRSTVDLYQIWDDTVTRWFAESVAGAAAEYEAIRCWGRMPCRQIGSGVSR